jgi:hypothetical protein
MYRALRVSGHEFFASTLKCSHKRKYRRPFLLGSLIARASKFALAVRRHGRRVVVLGIMLA